MASQVEQQGPDEHGGTSLLLVAAAGICWALALALLLLANLNGQPDVLAPQRLLFYLTLPLAGLLTFLPLQVRMGLPGLALEGIGGTTLLLYMLAFVPPPTDWLFSLPDTPVYVLFGLSLFWSCAALAQPLIFGVGKRLFASRLRQLDRQRVRRQAHEFGLLVALSAGLASLRVLTAVSFLLLLLILVTAEILFLARVRASQS